jgi:hypothetical protein
MIFMCAMAEVKAKYIRPGDKQLTDHLHIAASGTKRRDDFGRTVTGDGGRQNGHQDHFPKKSGDADSILAPTKPTPQAIPQDGLAYLVKDVQPPKKQRHTGSGRASISPNLIMLCFLVLDSSRRRNDA